MKTALLLVGVLTAFAAVPAWLFAGALAGILAVTASAVFLASYLIVEHMDWGHSESREPVLESQWQELR